MYILFGSYGKQFVKIDKIPNSNKFFSLSLCLSVCLSIYLKLAGWPNTALVIDR